MDPSVLLSLSCTAAHCTVIRYSRANACDTHGNRMTRTSGQPTNGRLAQAGVLSLSLFLFLFQLLSFRQSHRIIRWIDPPNDIQEYVGLLIISTPCLLFIQSAVEFLVLFNLSSFKLGKKSASAKSRIRWCFSANRTVNWLR